MVAFSDALRRVIAIDGLRLFGHPNDGAEPCRLIENRLTATGGRRDGEKNMPRGKHKRKKK